MVDKAFYEQANAASVALALLDESNPKRPFPYREMSNDPETLTLRWFDAWRTKDAGAIERMIAADYVYVAPNGSVMDRDSILAIIHDPSYGITEGAITEVEVMALGPDVTLVRHHWRGRGTLRGQVFVDDHQCVMVWYRDAADWRVHYEQASPVMPSRQSPAIEWRR